MGKVKQWASRAARRFVCTAAAWSLALSWSFCARGEANTPPPGAKEKLLARIEAVVGLAAFESLTPFEKHRIVNLAWHAEQGRELPAACFIGDVNPAMLAAYHALVAESGPSDKFFGDDFRRWGSTVTDGGGLSQGDPITLTYSFVPDGISLLEAPFMGFEEEDTPSDLFATFDAQFGSTAAWKSHFATVFDLWSDLTGIDYVEVSDDGAAFPTSPGAAGLRGDIRIGGHSIDGAGGGTVAYNYFPTIGDMVLDTDNVSFFGNPANSFRNLKNTVSHEHGHGLGFEHVCPNNSEKIMEPLIPLSFDHSRTDDIANANRKYGDPLEKGGRNDTPGTATGLGNLSNGAHSIGNGIVDPRSADSVNDADYYAFSVGANKRVTVSLHPVGGSVEQFVQQPMDTGCTMGGPGAAVDHGSVVNLNIQILASNGSTVLKNAASAPAGSSETISQFLLPSPGSFFLRVNTNDAEAVPPDKQIQLYEIDFFMDTFNPNADDDGDGLTNGQEASLGTDHMDADTDGDGLTDAEEVNGTTGFFTDPLDADTDGDLLSDGDEVNGVPGFTSDPLTRHTDTDGVNDFVESLYGTDPNDPDDFPIISSLSVPFFR